jgi:uncharacterized protein YdhG (YjbR/CyaY superfamily)
MKKTMDVTQYMETLDHPFKAEVQALRDIIKSANQDITEEIKWNAPSYSYLGEYLVTFNLRERKRIHLVFHNPHISKVKSKLLEGNYVDRRMTYFANQEEVEGSKELLIKVLNDLIELQRK